MAAQEQKQSDIEAIPVLVFTGYLGSGKTTIIFNLIKQLPHLKCAWLKNEFGSVEVDSQLAKENAISTKEILNGCLCCTLTGRLGDAMKEIVSDYKPQLLIVETSGSAFPGPIAWEIRRLKEEGSLNVWLDALINVVDVANFSGYEDKSYTAKLQAKYTDLILINKHELVTSDQFDAAMDDVYELNPDTPKVKTEQGFVPYSLMLGLHTALFRTAEEASIATSHDSCEQQHHQREVQCLTLTVAAAERTFEPAAFRAFAETLSKENYYRVKGFIHFADGPYLFNMAFGRYQEPVKLQQYSGATQLSFVGIDMFLPSVSKHIQNGLQVSELCIKRVE